MDSGKEWKPNKDDKEKDPLQSDPEKSPLGGRPSKVIVHPVVGDHLKMGDNANLDQGPGKRK